MLVVVYGLDDERLDFFGGEYGVDVRRFGFVVGVFGLRLVWVSGVCCCCGMECGGCL